MVTAGQFLERPALIPLADGAVLEGVAHRGDMAPAVLILPPTPLEGGGMDHVFAAECACAAARAGHPTLRFNFRGVGASHGTRGSDAAGWLEDAAAALALARDNAGGAKAVLAALGGSSALALQLAAGDAVAGVLLIEPQGLSARELRRLAPLPWPMAVVLPEGAERMAWAEALGEVGARRTVVPGASAGHVGHLAPLGRAMAELLGRVTASRACEVAPIVSPPARTRGRGPP